MEDSGSLEGLSNKISKLQNQVNHKPDLHDWFNYHRHDHLNEREDTVLRKRWWGGTAYCDVLGGSRRPVSRIYVSPHSPKLSFTSFLWIRFWWPLHIFIGHMAFSSQIRTPQIKAKFPKESEAEITGIFIHFNWKLIFSVET